MEKTTEKTHRLVITDRFSSSVTGISKVHSFGVKEIVLETIKGNMSVKGEELGIKHLDLQEGLIEIEGRVDTVMYLSQSDGSARQSLWRRIFR